MPPEWLRDVERSLGLTRAHWTSVGHSDWADRYAVATAYERFFVKASTDRHASMLDAEADGLRALRSTNAIRVPQVVAELTVGGVSILVLEGLEFARARDGAELGRALAGLHRATPQRGPNEERFGWSRDNFIGGTAQHNEWSDDWCTFWREQRLAPQMALAARHAFDGEFMRNGERLLGKLASLLRNHDPGPSLLHGDLWSGNAGTLLSGEAVIFDPATYVGDREADIAMTELFGGFGADFYAAYGEEWPLSSDYAVHRDVYNLYHVLNHLNLFGRGYLAQVERMVEQLLALAG